MNRESKIIYDFGSNNGDDIPYYLMKADVVVAVEANPVLVQIIRDRFPLEIDTGKLFIENCVLTADEDDKTVPFYLHKHGHVLSQFLKPDDLRIMDFDEVFLPSKSVKSIIQKYGKPFYIKIDIEGYDQEILRSLFEDGIYPDFISAESHTIEVFSLLVSTNHYKSFNLVNGPTVPLKYGNCKIKTIDDTFNTYSFPIHSAGPFGEDIIGDWMNPDNFFELLALEGLGWKDIHATTVIKPNVNRKVYFKDYAWSYVLKKITPKLFRPLFNFKKSF